MLYHVKISIWFHGQCSSNPTCKHRYSVEAETPDYLPTSYIPVNSDALQYWKIYQESHPTIVKLVMKYIAIQSMSAAVERLFCIRGKIPTHPSPDPCRLGDRIFEQLVCIKQFSLWLVNFATSYWQTIWIDNHSPDVAQCLTFTHNKH